MPDLPMHTAPADASTTHTPGVLLNHPATGTRDHGGADSLDNLQTLCRPCNSRKGARV